MEALSSNPRLMQGNEVHLWFVDDERLRDEYVLARYQTILSGDERQRLRRFRFNEHKRQYLVSRALLRGALSHYMPATPPCDWVFSKNEYGKPYVHNASTGIELKFNLSHTQKLIVLGVTRSAEIGVDVEHISSRTKILDVAQSVFSPVEYEQLQALPAEHRVDRFLTLWTLKEAYVKARGLGLSMPLHRFAYTFPRPGEVSISFAPCREDRPEQWQFWQLLFADRHKVAVAVRSCNFPRKTSISAWEAVPLFTARGVTCGIELQSS